MSKISKPLLLLLFLALLLVLSLPAMAQEFDMEKVKVFTTGDDVVLRWCNPLDQRGPEWTSTLQILEFPPKENQVTSYQWAFSGDVVRHTWVPDRAGVYWVRANSCSEADGCSPWGMSVELQDGVEGCTVVPQRFIYYIKLGAPTGGGIE